MNRAANLDIPETASEREYVRQVAQLAKYRLVYLATPFTDYPHGHARAAADAARVAARLIQDGVRVFAPVPHSRLICEHGGVDARDHELWMAQCAPFMCCSSALAVAQMPGWETSRGVGEEIAFFNRLVKPLHFLPVDWLLEPARGGEGPGDVLREARGMCAAFERAGASYKIDEYRMIEALAQEVERLRSGHEGNRP